MAKRTTTQSKGKQTKAKPATTRSIKNKTTTRKKANAKAKKIAPTKKRATAKRAPAAKPAPPAATKPAAAAKPAPAAKPIARFAGKREIRSVADLRGPIERAQLELAGKLYDGEELPAEARLEPDPDSETSFASDCSLWKVVAGDTHLYDAWLYRADSGSIYRAGTTEEVAGIIQCGLECTDPAIRAQLGPAMVEAKLLPHGDMSYAEFAALLAKQ